MSLLIQKSTAKHYDVVNSEINSQTMSLSIQKSAMKNCVAADSKIDSDGGVISSFNLLFYVCLH